MSWRGILAATFGNIPLSITCQRYMRVYIKDWGLAYFLSLVALCRGYFSKCQPKGSARKELKKGSNV